MRIKQVKAAFGGYNLIVKGNAYFIFLCDKCLAIVFNNGFGAITPCLHQSIHFGSKGFRV